MTPESIVIRRLREPPSEHSLARIKLIPSKGHFAHPLFLIVIRCDGGEPLRGPLGPVHLQSVALYHGGGRSQDVLSVLLLMGNTEFSYLCNQIM